MSQVRERRGKITFRFCDVFKNLSFAFFLSLSLSPSIRHGLQWICSLITYTVLVK